LKYAVLGHFVTLFKPYCYFLHIISFVFNVKMFVSFILKNAINICTKYIIYLTGSKRVYSRNFNIAPCRDTRYQPIRFVTNGNSDCIFRKSLCTEGGQTLFSDDTTRTDSACRCDYTQGYAFVTVPRSKCYCRPSEEDCSCYLKKCQGIGYNLSAGITESYLDHYL
jgi:hypothetical protein